MTSTSNALSVESLRRDYKELFGRRELVNRMAKGQITASLHRTVFGSLWLLLIPALQILVYYLLIVVIFRRGSGGDFFYLLAMGIMHYAVLQQTISSAVGGIVGNSGMLLQIRLNPIVLVGVTFVKSLRTGALGVALFFVVYLLSGRGLGTNFLFYPLIIASLLVLTWSLSLIVATICVYSRDLGNFLRFFLQMLKYSCPVIYPSTLYPEALRDLFYLNPVAVHFGLLQWAIFNQPLPPPHTILIALAFVGALFFIAHAVLSRGRRGFTKTF